MSTLPSVDRSAVTPEKDRSAVAQDKSRCSVTLQVDYEHKSPSPGEGTDQDPQLKAAVGRATNSQ